MSRVINMKQEPNACMHGGVRIDRSSMWGNPYRIGRDGNRAEVIEQYRQWLWIRLNDGDIALHDLAELHGKDLVCHCAPLPCHGEVLMRAAKWAYESIVKYEKPEIELFGEMK